MEIIMTMMMTMMMEKKMMIKICMVMPIKEGDSLLQAVFLKESIVGKYFNFRIVSMYKLIYCN